MSGALLSQGYGTGCIDREELFNSLSVQLLCDYVYHIVTQNMDEKKRTEFDAALNECGQKTTQESQEEIVERLLRDPMAEVELV